MAIIGLCFGSWKSGARRRILLVAAIVLFQAPGLVAGTGYQLPDELGPDDFPNDVIESFINSGEQGILISFLADPNARGTKLQREFYLRPGDPLRARLRIGNFKPHDIHVGIVALLNYRKTPLHGADFQTPILIPTGEFRELAFKTLPLEQGKHDFELVFVTRPAQETGYSFRHVSVLLTHRVNVNAGSDSFASRVYRRHKAVPIQDSGIHNELRELPRPALYLFNPYESTMHYAVVPILLDASTYEVKMTFDPLYAEIDSNTGVRIPMDGYGSALGLLRTMVFANPFTDLEHPRGFYAHAQTHASMSNALDLGGHRGRAARKKASPSNQTDPTVK